MNFEGLSLQRLLALRKLTRATSEVFRTQIREHLSTLAPVIRPKALFGDYLQGGAKEPARMADKAYAELRDAYQRVSAGKPFGITKELISPFELEGTLPELVPMEYTHAAGSKRVVITTPFRWSLSYAGYSPVRFKELLAMRNPPADQVQRFILHFLVVHAIFTKQAGVARLLEALRYPVCVEAAPEFGELPVTCISAPVTTVRPPDDVIVESTELSGKDAFEEVADLDGFRDLRDPLREQLLGLAAAHGESLG